MKDTIIKFEIFEHNFIEKKNEIDLFFSKCKEENINLKFIRKLPPCITNKETKILERKNSINYSPHKITEEHGAIILDENNKVVSTNILYGEEFTNINSRFIKSPFIREECRSCEFNKNLTCRGIPNAKFQKQKEQLENKYGSDLYHAIRGDYENSMFTYGSRCENTCKFCLDKYLPNNIIRFSPDLNVGEIAHFLHYLPDFLGLVGCGFHCKSGDILHSPYFTEIYTQVIQHFLIETPNMFMTAGKGFNEEILDMIQNSKIAKTIQIGLSVNTFNEEYRKNFRLPDMDYISLISELTRRNIKYHISIMPFRSIVESGEIFSTFEKIFSINPNAQIRIQPASPNDYLEQGVMNEFFFDEKKLKNEIKERYPNKNFLIVDELFFAQEKLIYDAVEKVRQIVSEDKKYLILSPKKTKNYFRILESNKVTIKPVSSGLGFKDNVVTGILRVKDYIDAINRENEIYDAIIIPRNSFTVNLEDFSLESASRIYDHVKNKGTSIILI